MQQDNNRTIKERLADFLSYKGIGQDKFAQLANLSRGFANNVGDSIRQSSQNKIKVAFPELNILWLTSGIGEMLNTTQKNEAEQIDEPIILRVPLVSQYAQACQPVRTGRLPMRICRRNIYGHTTDNTIHRGS